MLRIAVQSKGRLYDETMLLLEEAGIKLNRGKRILLLSAKGFPVEVLFLRDDDIPQSVANGVADIGIVGENEYVEKGQEAKLIKRLGFSKCRLSLAIPKDEDYQGVEWFAGKTIATSYPEILKAYLAEKGVKADLHVISGSVEIAPGIGLADAIFDIVSSGSTLVSNQLKEVEVIMQSSGRQEICIVERSERQDGRDHRSAAGHEEPDHHAACRRELGVCSIRHSGETFLGNHR